VFTIPKKRGINFTPTDEAIFYFITLAFLGFVMV
jgi:hypothetical protein